MGSPVVVAVVIAVAGKSALMALALTGLSANGDAMVEAAGAKGDAVEKVPPMD